MTSSRATGVARADAAVTANAGRLSLTSAQGRTVRDVVTDTDGAQHVRYDRTYRGLPVLGGDLVVHLAPGGAYEGAERATRSDLAVPSTTPAVKAATAADKGLAALRSAHRGTTFRQAKAKPQLVVDALHGTPGWPGAPPPSASTAWATPPPASSSPTPSPAPASTPGTPWRPPPGTASPCTAAPCPWRPPSAAAPTS